MSKKIEHSGIITAIENGNIKVQIIQVSACSGCHAKGACTASDMEEKTVDVISTDKSLKVGDLVVISGKSSMGFLAVFLAFVIPFILILIMLFVTRNFTANEAISGTISLSVLIPYYIILSFFNNKLKEKFQFQIESKQ